MLVRLVREFQEARLDDLHWIVIDALNGAHDAPKLGAMKALSRTATLL